MTVIAAQRAAGAFDPASVIDGKRHRLTLGLRRLDLAHWLVVDEDSDREMTEKRRLLAEHPDDVLATTPQGDEASAELLDVILANLRQHHPGARTERDPGLHPMHAAALLVQEDLCVMTHESGHWLMTSACVCFPSRWRVTDKIGQTVAGIHTPVPGYDAIAGPVDSLFDRLEVDRPMWRTNWTLIDDHALFQPAPRPALPTDPGSWTFRVERQTLRRLPGTGAVVFTIRTFRRRLAELADDDATALAAMAESVHPTHAEYRDWHDLEALIHWLKSKETTT